MKGMSEDKGFVPILEAAVICPVCGTGVTVVIPLDY